MMDELEFELICLSLSLKSKNEDHFLNSTLSKELD